MEVECQNCGSTNFSLDNGFYYCDECGTKSNGVEYQAVDGNSKMFSSVTKVAKERVITKEESDINEKFFGRSSYKSFDYNEAVDKVGARLSSAVQIICSICYVLVEECGASKGITDVSVGLFQKYLSTYKAAFCESELKDESEEVFSVQRLLTPRELNKLIKEKEKIAEELINKEINERLLALGLFDPCGDSKKEKKKDKKIDIVLKPEDYYMVKETSVSKKALDRAGHIYLEIDIIFSIVYMTLIYSGIHFIQMSDLMRWYREGRFLITQDQLNDIQIVTYEEATSSFRVQPRFHIETLQKRKSSPLSKSYYSSMFLWQFLSLPRLVVPLDAFDELVNRYIYELNLPKVFSSRIQKYRKMFNPLKHQSCDLWKGNFPLIDNCDDVIEDKFSDKNCNFNVGDFYKVAIPKTHQTYNNFNMGFVDFSIEIKAMALILFALKQEFSFNNKDEFEKSKEKDDFYFVDWLKQLNLRAQLADGKSINYVTSERNLYSFKYTNKKIFGNVGDQYDFELYDHLDSKFDHQIPSKDRILFNQSSLSDCLEGIIDVPRKSDNEDVLYAPIKFYGEECIYESSLQDNDNVLLIKKNFSNYKLKDFKDIEEKGHYLFPSVDCVTCLKVEEEIDGKENRSVENSIVYRDEFEEIKTSLSNGKKIIIGEIESKRVCFCLSSENFKENIFDLRIAKFSNITAKEKMKFNVFKSLVKTNIPNTRLTPTIYNINFATTN